MPYPPARFGSSRIIRLLAIQGRYRTSRAQLHDVISIGFVFVRTEKLLQ
jgi:hypothetical protein